MRRVIVAALLALSASQMSGQRLEIRDVFKQMPDSLMPYLSQNNRLDFIDFLDANMKAEPCQLFHNRLEKAVYSPSFERCSAEAHSGLCFANDS